MSNTKKHFPLVVTLIILLGICFSADVQAQSEKRVRFKDLYISQIPEGTILKLRRKMIIPADTRRVYIGTVNDIFGNKSKVFIRVEASEKERFIKPGAKFEVKYAVNAGRGKYYLYYFGRQDEGEDGQNDDLSQGLTFIDESGQEVSIIDESADADDWWESEDDTNSTEEGVDEEGDEALRGISQRREEKRARKEAEREEEERQAIEAERQRLEEESQKVRDRRIEVLGTGHGIKLHKLREHFCIKRKKGREKFVPSK